MKSIIAIHNPPSPHWVGDGFPVRSLFSYHSMGKQLSPFLLLDHAGPADFSPSRHKRGVGEHPHRGFETVTIAYQGEVAHRDSTGAGGIIGPGDVQWMTAGAGILHEEFHSEAFTRQGGTLEMVQLWVNLPARDKMTPPTYQTLLNANIPNVALPDEAGTLRVIAGEYDGHRGPAHTFTPVDVWDMKLKTGKQAQLPVRQGHTAAIVVLHGTVLIGGEAVARAGQWVELSQDESGIVIEANNDSTLLILGGEPIDEPVMGYGPFVMNTQDEIAQAIADLRSGSFGQIPPAQH